MGNWPVYFVAGDRGADTANGLTEDSPLKTLREALRRVHSWGGAAEILLRDCLVQGTVIEEGGVTLRGMGAAFGGGSSKIQALGKDRHCLDIRAPDFRADRVTTVGPVGRWTGVGYRLREGSQNATLRDCWHMGHPNTVTDESSGGTALMTSDCEGSYIENFRFARCRRGVRQGHESSGLHIVNLKGSQASCEALIIDGRPTGGIKVTGWKTTHCGKSNGISADLGPDPTSAGGQGIYIGFDADESSWPNKVLIRSTNNTFIGGCSAPSTSFEVLGDLNGFDGLKVNGAPMTVKGNKNRLDRMQIAGSLVIQGQGNKVGMCDNDDSHKLVMGEGNERY